MKRYLTLLSLIALLSETVSGYEAGALSLDTPNVLKSGEGSFSIRHRFYGEADDFERFLGTDDGGNMQFLLKYAVMDRVLITAEHTREMYSYAAGVEYAERFAWGAAGFKVSGLSLEVPGYEARRQSYVANASYQSPLYPGHLSITLNVGYDGYYEHQMMGVGFDLGVDNFIPYLSYTERLSLLAEYYPRSDKVGGISGKHDAYAVGLKFQTYAHHFEILLSNSQQMDARTMSLGTDSEKIHFGFNINRRF